MILISLLSIHYFINTSKIKLDFFKVGVLLLGISSTIFAGIATHWYYKINIEQQHFSKDQFFLYCRDKVIVIKAHYDLKNVKIFDEDKNIVCSFEKIKEGSDEICRTNKTGLFIVSVDDFKRVIHCEEYPPYLPAPTK